MPEKTNDQTAEIGGDATLDFGPCETCERCLAMCTICDSFDWGV